MTSLTLIDDGSGHFQMHLTGCSDIKRSHVNEYNPPAVYESATLLDAIVTADTDMAGWFGRQPYDGLDDEIGEKPWGTTVVGWAPCFKKAVKAAGITFDGVDRPVLAGTTTPTSGVDKSTATVAQSSRQVGTSRQQPGQNPEEGEPEMSATAAATSKPMTRSERIRSGRSTVKSGIAGILAGTTTADAVLAEVAAITYPDADAIDGVGFTVEAAEPVKVKGKAVKNDAGVVIATVAAEPKVDPLAGRSLISMEERDRILAGSDKALIARVEAGTYVRPNGKVPGGSVKSTGTDAKYYPRWRLAVSLTDKMAERVTTVPVEPSWGWANPDGRKPRESARKVREVRESAKGAAALPAPEKVAKVRKAKAAVEATETLAGSEYIAAVGADETQEALAVLAATSLGSAHDDLPF